VAEARHQLLEARTRSRRESSANVSAAADADQSWAAGEPQIAGTWAQVRIGAAIAHLQQGQL